MADNPETVTISKADFAILQASYNTLNSLWSSPKHGIAVKKAIKDIKPDTAIPELDIAERYAEPLKQEIADARKENKALSERLDAQEKARKDKEDLDGIYSKIDAVVKKRGMTDEGREGLIKLMQERQIADPEAAAALYIESLPKPKPTTASTGQFLPQSMNLFGTDDDKGGEFAEFWKDPIKAQDKVIAQILNEPEAQAA